MNPDASRCCFYLAHKRRFCKTEKRPGSQFCFTHHAEALDGLSRGAEGSSTGLLDTGSTAASGSNSSHPKGRRVPCPINPNHTVYEKDVPRHVRVCPDARFDTAALPYYSKNCHALRGVVGLVRDSDGAVNGGDEEKDVRFDDVVEPDSTKRTANNSNRDEDEDEEESHNPAAPAPLDTQEEGEAKMKLGKRILAYFEHSIGPFIRVHRSARVTSSATERTTQKHSSQHVALCDLMMEAMAACTTESANKSTTSGGSKRLAVDPQQAAEEASQGTVGAGGGGIVAVDRSSSSSCVSSLTLPNYMELGAGKGGLAYAMLERVPSAEMFVVVDIGGFRRKRDGCVRNSTVPFVRLRINLKDLNLAKVAALQPRKVAAVAGGTLPHQGQPQQSQQAAASSSEATESQQQQQQRSGSKKQLPFTIMGKHLCGACTDFALSCVTNHTTRCDDEQEEEGGFVAKVIVIATCCHHLCELRHIPALGCGASIIPSRSLPTTTQAAAAWCNSEGGVYLPPFALRSEPSSAADVDNPRCSSSSPSGTTTPHDTDEEGRGTGLLLTASDFSRLVKMTSWAVSGNVSEDKRLIGVAAKRVIDTLRVQYLRTVVVSGRTNRKRFESVELVEYTSLDITKENVCIVAR